MEENLELTTKIEDTFKVSINDHGFVTVTFLKPLYQEDENTSQAKQAIEKALTLIKENGDTPVKALVDLRPMNDKAFLSTESKTLYKNFVISDKITKVAVLGSTDSQTSIANFILTFFDRRVHKKLSWFSTEEEATLWLNS